MRAGDLNSRIVITQSVAGDGWTSPTDGAGVEVARVWANIRHPNGSQAIQADAVTSNVRASIRIRYRRDIKAGMRATHGQTVYGIQAVLSDEVGRVYTDLACEVLP